MSFIIFLLTRFKCRYNITRNDLQFSKYCLHRLARMDQALKEMDNDGLNSLKYSAEVTEYSLFTLIRANLENAL